MRQKEQIRIGVVGASWFADLWYLPVIAKHPHAVLSAICSAGGSSAKRMAERYGARAVYTSYEEMFRQEELDGVCIVTPNDVHAPIARSAVRQGISVLCEKPLAMNAEEARMMLREAEEAGVVHGVNFTYREHPGVRRMKAMVEEGRIGRILSGSFEYTGEYGMSGPPGWRGTASRGGAGGVLADLGSHLIDLAQFVLGDQVAEVCGDVYIAGAGERRDAAADAVTFLARFSQGVRGTFHTSWVEPQGGNGQTIRLEFTGDKGKLRFAASEKGSILEIALQGGNWAAEPVPGTAAWDAEGEPSEAKFRPWRLTERNEVWKWIDHVYAQKYGTVPASGAIPDFRDGFRVQAVMEAVLESAERRTWVSVP